MLRRTVQKIQKPLFIRNYTKNPSGDSFNEQGQEEVYFQKRNQELIEKLAHQKEEITKAQKATHEIKGEIKKQHEQTQGKLDSLLDTIKKLQEEVQTLKGKK